MKARHFISIGLPSFMMGVAFGMMIADQPDPISMAVCQNFSHMYCVEPVTCKMLMMS